MLASRVTMNTRCQLPCGSTVHLPRTRSATVSRFPLRSPKQLAPRQRRNTVVRAGDRLPGWEQIWSQLTSKKLRSLSPTEAQSFVEGGDAVIVDVRLKADYDQAHPKNALSVPIFQLLDWGNPSVLKVFKFIACTSNGVTAVELNPNFVEQLRAAANGKNVILACETGGTISPSVNFQTGKASRSLKAAFQALNTGVPFEVLHLNGGVYGWYKEDLPFDGEYDARNAGKTPNIAEKPTGAYIKE